jgi:branched-chain amino acid transport system permease protein
MRPFQLIQGFCVLPAALQIDVLAEMKHDLGAVDSCCGAALPGYNRGQPAASSLHFLVFFFEYTRLGREMRACAQSRDAAALCGLPVRNLVTLSFVLSAGIGALAGCVVSPITYTSYGVGAGLAIKGFTVAILGGLGNSRATGSRGAIGGGLGNSLGGVAAGLVGGLLESFSVFLLPTAFKDTVSLTILLAILVLRPAGLFGSREAARLKAF